MALRCLIVDDNPRFLAAARDLLEREGIDVVGVATTSGEPLERVAELRPEVTLVDIDLGLQSGIDLVRRLTLDGAPTSSRLILISTHAGEDFADLIETGPAAGFLSKV